MSNYTSGPWYISKQNALRIIESGPRALTLATCSTKGRGVTESGSYKEAHANAKLMAAAPELLEALKKCLTALERASYYAPEDTLAAADEARAAIAKAE